MRRAVMAISLSLTFLSVSTEAQEPVQGSLEEKRGETEEELMSERSEGAASKRGRGQHRWPAQVSAIVEFGFVTPLAHTIQLGEEGTEFDYVEEGGQDISFPFTRMGLEAKFGQRHNLIFLLQPLNLDTRVNLDRDIRVAGASFAADTPMILQYGFSFARVSYLFDFFEQEETELGIGLSLQLRNASIGFEKADGTLRRERRDMGPVPILKVRGRQRFDSGWWLGLEADGFYAPGKWLNLSEDMVEGLIVDASARVGMNLNRHFDTFLNIRYLGGGSEGRSSDDVQRERGDGYASNWLHLLTISIGLEYTFNPAVGGRKMNRGGRDGAGWRGKRR